jgi:hypothetical protein
MPRMNEKLNIFERNVSARQMLLVEIITSQQMIRCIFMLLCAAGAYIMKSN